MKTAYEVGESREVAGQKGWQNRLFTIIFEADTPAGKRFDVILIAVIAISILAVMLESVEAAQAKYGSALRIMEWVITVFFTIEYALRLSCVERPANYARSFFGVIDLLAILPSFVSLVLPGSQSLLVIRGLRLLRVMRIFKLAGFLGQANLLLVAMRASRRKILVFLGTVLLLDLILGSAMYLIEGVEGGFTSIPRSVYWAIVTMTTVGYGDIAPVTVPGQLLASVVMLLGYAILAVPTGIVTAEIVEQIRPAEITTRGCPHCLSEGHPWDARFCKDCGEPLPPHEGHSEDAEEASEPNR
ncbi:MAG: ion transporter [Deltaproteobacteria bacterium]|nr:ion transporter [Deltaproteobacteria bacterium]